MCPLCVIFCSSTFAYEVLSMEINCPSFLRLSQHDRDFGKFQRWATFYSSLSLSLSLSLSFSLSLFLSVFLLLNLDLPLSISCAREMHVIYNQQTWSLTRLTMQSINQNSLKNVYIKFPWELWHVVWISSTFSSDFGHSIHERRMQFVIPCFVHPPRISSSKNSFGGLEILFRIFVSSSIDCHKSRTSDI